MEITVAARARRGLSRLDRYRSNANDGGSGLPLEDAPLASRESMVGIYENRPGSPDERVLITDRGLWIRRDEKWLHLPYSEMVSVDLEGGGTPVEPNGVEIQLRSGSTSTIAATGGDGLNRTRDAYAVLMFLDHVLGDRKRQASTGALEENLTGDFPGRESTRSPKPLPPPVDQGGDGGLA